MRWYNTAEDESRPFYDRPVVQKAVRKIFKAVEAASYYAKDKSSTVGISDDFLNGMCRVATMCTSKDGTVHFEVIKRLFKVRYLLTVDFRDDEYLKEVGDNEEQRKNNEEMKAWIVGKMKEMELELDIHKSNYDWLCAIGRMREEELRTIVRDKRGRKSNKLYRYALIDNDSIKFYSKEEAYAALRPTGIKPSTFERRSWKKYLIEIKK